MSKEITQSEEKIIAAHKAADTKGKQMLEGIYGAELFVQDAWMQIDSVEAACKVMGHTYAAKFSAQATKGLLPHEVALRMLMCVAAAINKLTAVKIDMLDANQRKWYCWYNVIAKKKGVSGRGLSLGAVRYAGTHSTVGPRPYVGSEAAARHIAEQFNDLCEKATLIDGAAY
jgi:hypothetical protein